MLLMKEKLVKNNKLFIIILISLLIIGIIIFTNFLSFSNVEKLIIEQLIDKQSLETKHAAHLIETHITQVKDELVTLSKFPLMDNLDINQCSGNMKIVHKSIEGKIDSLLKVNPNGDITECSTQDFSNYVGLNIKNKDYFSIPQETNQPYISEIERQGASRQIIISAPLFETTEYTPYPNFNGEFKGELLSIIEIRKLYNLYLHPILNPETNLFLLVNLETNETIIKSDDIGEYIEIEPYLKQVGLEKIINIKGLRETIVTSADIILGQDKWQLIILTPLEKVNKEVKSIQERHIFNLIFITILFSLILIILIMIFRNKEEIEIKLNKAKITLEKLGINIEIEGDKFNQTDIKLDPKKVYLIKDDSENNAHELFIGTLNRGYAGLGIVRENPKEIKEKYNLKKTSFIWLSKSESKEIPCETDIVNISELIKEFIEKSEKSVVLIDRLDYIFNQNESKDVIKAIQALKDLANLHKCIIIISANPYLVNNEKLKSIEAESVDLYGQHLIKNINLPANELEILRFINNHNIKNQLISYKNITHQFNITKPTTRVKIKKLQDLGLLQIEQKGRFKALKITSAGRKIIR